MGEVKGKDRPLVDDGTIRKRPWLVTVLEAEDGRLATEATVEPSATKRGSRGRKTLDERRQNEASSAGSR